MASITVNGKTYGLRFDMYAMEQIEEEYGSVKAAFEALRGGKQLKTTRNMFRILANSDLSFHKEEESVTGDEIKHVNIVMVKEISDAIRQAIAEGSKSETTDGNEADDQIHDVYLEELERKKE